MKPALALETAGPSCSCAVGYQGSVLAYRFEPMTRGQVERVLPMVEEVLAEAVLTPQDLGQVAVTVGPGSFTGIRVGLAAAQGLSLACSLPLTALTTTDVLVATSERPVCAVLGTRSSRVYVDLFATSDSPSTPQGMEGQDARSLLATFQGSIVQAGGQTRLPGASEGQVDARAMVHLLHHKTYTPVPAHPLYLDHTLS